MQNNNVSVLLPAILKIPVSNNVFDCNIHNSRDRLYKTNINLKAKLWEHCCLNSSEMWGIFFCRSHVYNWMHWTSLLCLLWTSFLLELYPQLVRAHSSVGCECHLALHIQIRCLSIYLYISKWLFARPPRINSL